MDKRSLIIGTLAVGSALVPSIAFSQVAPSSGAQGAPSDPADSNGEILVTAQRRSERLQDVPVSVAAISGDKLAASGVTSIADIGQLVPSLSVSSAIGFTTTYLRGIGTGAGAPGIETPIAMYLDGVYYASSQSTMFNLASVDRIEVLKGPQGTLFGRNATGGLIQIFTRDPTQHLKIDAHLGYGNYGTLVGDAYVGGGIAPNLAADLQVQGSTASGGYGKNFATGHTINRNLHDIGVRSKWVFTPGDLTKITFIADYNDSYNTMIAARIPEGSVAAPALNAPPEVKSPWDINQDFDPLYKNRNYGVSLNGTHDFGDISIMNIAAYRRARTHFAFDIDFSPVPFLNGDLVEKEWQFSDELQISSSNPGPLKWTAGAFYFRASGQYDPSGAIFPGGLVAPFSRFDDYVTTGTESISGFAQASYEFLPATNLTLGSRYSWERRDLHGFQTGTFMTGGTIPLTTYPSASATFQKPTFRVSIDHRFSPEALVYASFNTGFKSGGFNAGVPTDPAFRPETIRAYETGLKTNLFDRRLRLNWAAFYYDYSNIQIQKTALAGVGIVNGASATIYGLDMDFDATVTPRFHLSGSAGLLHSRYRDFPDALTSTPTGDLPLVLASADGNDLLKAPHFQGTLTGDYGIPFEGGTIHADGSANYNSGYFVSADNVVRQHSFAKFNASISWVARDDRYSVKAWIKNISNQAVYGYGNSLVSGQHYVNYEAPRTFGLTFGFNY